MASPGYGRFLCFVLLMVAWCRSEQSVAQLIIQQPQTPQALVQNYLLGPGIFSSNVTFNGDAGNQLPPVVPTYQEGQVGRFNGANTCLDIDAGIYLCSGRATEILPGPNNELNPSSGWFYTSGFFPTPEIDLSHLSRWPLWEVQDGFNIGNKAVLEFDFIPTSDMISVRYVFSSEEYERAACAGYNDVMGFLLSGPGINGPYSNNAINIALVPGSLDPVCVNSINSGETIANANGDLMSMDPWAVCRDNYPSWENNVQYYKYNGGEWDPPNPNNFADQIEEPYASDPFYIQHNGLTVVLTATAAVECGETYHMKMAVGNAGSSNYLPSAVWMENHSFTASDRFSLTVGDGPSVEFNDPDTIFYESDCDSIHLNFNRMGGFYLDEWLQVQVEGEATNGVDITAAIPDSVHFNQLDSTVVIPIAVPVDADGPETLTIKLITCNGVKELVYNFVIDQKPPLAVQLDDIDLNCPDDVTLTPIVTGGGNDPDAYEYLWNTGDTTASITVHVDETTHFWVTVQDCWAEAVTDSAWVNLVEHDPLTVQVPTDTTLDCNETTDLEMVVAGGAGGYEYLWQANGQTIATLPVAQNVAGTDPATWYVATVTDQCGNVASDSLLVSLADPIALIIDLTPDVDVPCLGDTTISVNVLNGAGDYSYQWTLNGQLQGSDSALDVPAQNPPVYYVATVTDLCGTQVSDSVRVGWAAAPPIEFVATGDTVMCAGQEAVLSVITVQGGGGQYTYTWNTQGAGPNDGPELVVHPDQSTAYTITITDECGNQADTTLWAMVQQFDPLVLQTSPDTAICPGQEFLVWVIPSGGAGNLQINWGDGSSSGQESWSADHGDETLTVQVIDECGNTVSASINMGVVPVDAAITEQDLDGWGWHFIGVGHPPSDDNHFFWDLGDGTTVDGQGEVTHQYPGFDDHVVTLQVTTPEGCIATDTTTVHPPASVYFPNSFTPNNDGFNDRFGGIGAGLDTYELLIFNRWGELIFESTDLASQWDGRVNGQEPVQGVYVYRYRVAGRGLPIRQGFGHVTLLQ